MFVERVVPPELMFRNRCSKRGPHVSRRTPAERSLVNCNHLATSDTKVLPEETLAERLARKTEYQKRRAGQRYIYNQIKETLRGLALRLYQEHMDRYWDGLETPDKDPWSPARDLRRLEACQSEWIGFKPGG